MATNSKKSDKWNCVGSILSVQIQYLPPEKTVVEEYRKRYKCDVLEDLRVIQKDEKKVNMIYHWCIFLCRGNFEGMELYNVLK